MSTYRKKETGHVEAVQFDGTASSVERINREFALVENGFDVSLHYRHGDNELFIRNEAKEWPFFCNLTKVPVGGYIVRHNGNLVYMPQADFEAQYDLIT